MRTWRQLHPLWLLANIKAPIAGLFSSVRSPNMLQRHSLGLLTQLLPVAACFLLVVAGRCPRWRGDFRDCTCGISYRDEEIRCCTADTCEAPVLVSHNRSCPFLCENGGVFDRQIRRCNCQPGFFGLCCEQETEHCGGTHLGLMGNLSSPGYPNHYSNSLRCVWRISTDPIRRVALGNAGAMFEVEPGTTRQSCNHDWVAVYDGHTHNSPLIGRFCGDMMPTVRSSGRHMLVEFSSDWQQRRKGFQLHYITFFAVEACGRTEFSRQTGLIVSPHYPLAYPPDISCTYHITVRPRHMLVLSTEEMDVPSQENCHRGDRIIVSHKVTVQLEPLFVLCGTTLFEPIFISNSSLVSLNFSSGPGGPSGPSGPSGGRFKLRFEQIPDFTL